MYAVIEDSGQQFRVSEGDVLNIDLCNVDEEAKEVQFDRVLLVNDDKEVKVGTPLVAGAKVVAEILAPMVKGTKLHIYHWRRRKSSRKKTGHRQKFTRVRITKIVV